MSTPYSSSRAEALLREAVATGASDMHFKAEGEGTQLILRVNGALKKEPKRILPNFAALISEFETLGGERTFEDEYEWEARFSLLVEGQLVYFWLAWYRDRGSQAMSVRIYQSAHWLSFSHLGLSERDAAILDELIKFPSGVIVGYGPGGSGHATTLNALLERLAQRGRRVASLADYPDPHLQGVTQIEGVSEGFGEQVAALAGQFDVVALGNVGGAEKVRAAFDLAAKGHLVLGLSYGSPIISALHRLLDSGISAEEIRTHFLGGWSQRLARRAKGRGRIGLFNCMSREEALAQVLDAYWLQDRTRDEEQAQAFWRNAEEKIAAGLIAREEATKVLQYL